jgi:hypothetical protein
MPTRAFGRLPSSETHDELADAIIATGGRPELRRGCVHLRRTSSRGQRRSVCGVTITSRVAVGAAGLASARQGRRDRRAQRRAPAVAARARPADVARRATRRLWRLAASAADQQSEYGREGEIREREKHAPDAPIARYRAQEEQERRASGRSVDQLRGHRDRVFARAREPLKPALNGAQPLSQRTEPAF